MRILNPFFTSGAWWMRSAFRRALSRTLADRAELLDGLWSQIECEYRNILRSNATRAVDGPAGMHLTLAAYVLATYRKLAPAFPDRRELLDRLTRAFGQAYRGTGFPASMRVLLRVSRVPYEALRRSF